MKYTRIAIEACSRADVKPKAKHAREDEGNRKRMFRHGCRRRRDTLSNVGVTFAATFAIIVDKICRHRPHRRRRHDIIGFLSRNLNSRNMHARWRAPPLGISYRSYRLVSSVIQRHRVPRHGERRDVPTPMTKIEDAHYQQLARRRCAKSMAAMGGRLGAHLSRDCMKRRAAGHFQLAASFHGSHHCLWLASRLSLPQSMVRNSYDAIIYLRRLISMTAFVRMRMHYIALPAIGIRAS